MIWTFVAISAAFVGVLAYLGVRLIHVLEALVNVLSKRQKIGDGVAVSSPTEDSTITVRRVEPLPPEVVAPNLFKPPRPRGGFGSAVRTDDDLQIQQGNSGETGSEGGQVSDATPDDPADPGPADAGASCDITGTPPGARRRRK